MFDLLRVARVARTFLGVVGGRGRPWFGFFCDLVAVVGVFFVAGAGAAGFAVAVALAVCLYVFRYSRARTGARRA